MIIKQTARNPDFITIRRTLNIVIWLVPGRPEIQEIIRYTVGIHVQIKFGKHKSRIRDNRSV